MSNAEQAAPLNGRFVRPASPEDALVAWGRMSLGLRGRFVKAVGPESAVRDYGLSPVEVALAWHTNKTIEERLRLLLGRLRGRPAGPGRRSTP